MSKGKAPGHNGTIAQSAEESGLTRRRLIQTGAAALAAPAILRGGQALAADRVIKLGFVSPRTGPLAGFGEADGFVLEGVRKALAQGISVGGKTLPVRIIDKDSQSNPSRAADVASDLILGEKVDIILAASTPDTTNPVADQAEVNEVPCITTDAPWQAYFFGRKGEPARGFTWTYHFFWGLEDVISAYTDLWKEIPTNKVVGGLFPNDADGNAWADQQFGFPAELPRRGFRLVDGGRFPPGLSDFTQQISAFKAANVEILTGCLVPPDFATFWSQAAQQGFRPKIATVGKGLLFPSAIDALGPRGNGLSTEIWWTPSHPFKSGLTGQSSAELCDAYTKATGRPWTQPIGFKHALFEVAVDVLKRTKDVDDSKAILAAIQATDYHSLVGPVKWSGKPVKNVTKTPLSAGQWVRKDGKLDLVIEAIPDGSGIPKQGTLTPLG